MALRITLLLIAVLICSGVAQNYRNYDWSATSTTGTELKSTLIEENDNIIVTVWYKHLRGNEEQNKRNLVVVGSMKRLVRECHPKAKYTEADMSAYNANNAGYNEKAQDWKVDLSVLDDGPKVCILQNS